MITETWGEAFLLEQLFDYRAQIRDEQQRYPAEQLIHSANNAVIVRHEDELLLMTRFVEGSPVVFVFGASTPGDDEENLSYHST